MRLNSHLKIFISMRSLIRNKISFNSVRLISNIPLESIPEPRLKDKNDPFSSLYISGRYARQLYPVVTPHLNYLNYIGNWEKHLECVKMRNMPPIDVDLNKIKEFLLVQEEIDNLKEKLPKKKTITAEVEKLQNEIRQLLNMKYDLEELIIPQLLKIPNDLHAKTQLDSEILHCDLVKTELTKSHIELGLLNSCLEFSNVSPDAYYLSGKAALLELALISYFDVELREAKWQKLSAPHLVKSPIIEGCCVDPFDNRKSFSISSRDAKPGSTQHLVGGASIEAMAAYLTRGSLWSRDLPITLYSVGRKYSIESTISPRKEGLYNVPQSSEIAHFAVCSDEEQSDLIFEQNVAVLKGIFQKLKIPFRMARVSVKELGIAERLKVEFQVWSPHYEKFQSCAYVSHYGEYLSKRLMIYHNPNKIEGRRAKASFKYAHCVGGSAICVPSFIAAVMENRQCGNGTFDIPEDLEKYL